METTAQPPQNDSPVLSALRDPKIIRLRKRRMAKDKLARYAMTIGGVSVILALLLIFFYLLYVVIPLIMPASIGKLASYDIPRTSESKTLYLLSEEQAQVGVRLTDKPSAIFFNLRDGQLMGEEKFELPAGTTVTSFAPSAPATNTMAFGLSNGQALIVRINYKITYPDNVMTINPEIAYPMDEPILTVDEQGHALTRLAVQIDTDANTVAAITDDNRLILSGFTKEVDFLSDEVTLKRTGGEISLKEATIKDLLLDREQRTVYLFDTEGLVWQIDVTDKTTPAVLQRISAVDQEREVTAVSFLLGDISVVIGDSSGRISQWFPVRNNDNVKLLTKIREFHSQSAPIVSIHPEERRKGFVASDTAGNIAIYHATSHNNLLVDNLSDTAIEHFAITPRSNRLILQMPDGKMNIMDMHNEHPEVSWSSLWSKVWYESYDQPAYIWQSSSASNDFEPKFSLMPLSFGTLKAAFYALLVAIPVAIFGAVYAAYFMSSGMRKVVKPTIEIMEALPTVILGFLAGLWLAPFVESNLPGVFIFIVLLPFAVFATAFAWRSMPKSITCRVPDGWQAALLILPILLLASIAFSLSHPIEAALFGGNMPQWLNSNGIDFDQRNALVVGIAMGLAVIPSIFSITEDAIFSVPKHLTSGSLALGATPWQTMTRVVILTASPGIFSAVMIGLGRAVGETMIVLMATGNTAVMDFSIFEGLRSMSANIAVEMPESEVGSTHYRLLFLSGLVLFMFTFTVNTLAEIVRHRLRRKYSSL